VPLFLPRLVSRAGAADNALGFRWHQFRKNHEYQATLGFILFLLALVVIWRLRAH